MTVAIDASVGGHSVSATNPITFTQSISPTAANYGVVMICWEESVAEAANLSTTRTVTWDGVSMTRLAALAAGATDDSGLASNGVVELYGLVNPANGASKSIVATVGSRGNYFQLSVFATAYSGVGSVGVTTAFGSAAGTAISVPVTGVVSGGLAVCAMVQANNNNITSFAPNQRYQEVDQCGNVYGDGTGTGTVTFTATRTSAAAWAAIGLNLQPTGGGGSGFMGFF